ncbi:ankyrin repeat domain-containing protein [Winogradskyella maritima]|uniref:Ankyrin repeat domain-containing protein n=1 Tax=Winogradskyella maritima TaxID=1517766 RepID=A0ABV8AG51_9FLAO|nr:ankyrin repeat domain-containing protein [Winogradskyella maritima]
MKKTSIILALALGLFTISVNANEILTETSSTELVSPISEVSALCKAAATGDIDTVKQLIANGNKLDVKSNGMLPIHYAAKYNRVEVIKVLITAGSDVHTLCDKGYSALRHAEKTNAKDAALFLKRFKKAS